MSTWRPNVKDRIERNYAINVDGMDIMQRSITERILAQYVIQPGIKQEVESAKRLSEP